MFKVIRFLGRNLGSLITAFILALIVWASAVTAADPNQELLYPQPVPIEQIGKDPQLLIVGSVPEDVRITLNAPRSIQEQLAGDPTSVRAWIDLTDLGPGTHTLPVHVQTKLSPVSVAHTDPAEVHLVLEPLITRSITITLTVQGQPALGYRASPAVFQPAKVLVAGPESLVSQVSEVQAVLDIANASQSVDTNLTLQPVDSKGRAVNGVTLTPGSITVNLPINLLGGYRNVIVKVVTSGSVANGYKLTSISAVPPNVVVFSGDPQQLANLPGYLETKPLDLNQATAEFTTTVPLNMPSGISVVNDQKVMVHVGIAPIISNLTLTLPVNVVGLSHGLEAQINPTEVDVVLSGPVPVLNILRPSDIQVVVDVTGKEVGNYKIAPNIPSLPTGFTIDSITPSPIDITLSIAPTPTRTLTPGQGPSPTPVPTQPASPAQMPAPAPRPKP
jgi:YbbR domain-containing protein